MARRVLIFLVIGVAALLGTLHFVWIHVHISSEPAWGAPFISRAKLGQLNNTLSILRSELREQIKFGAGALPSDQSNTSLPPQELNHIQTPSPPATVVPKSKHERALIFTMDCIQSYEDNSRTGGAAGELIIRHSLQRAFEKYGVVLSVIRGDHEFARADMSQFSIILLDPWTWAARGWVPKRNLVGHERKIFILDFFGAQKLRGAGMAVPPERFLTAFPTPWNTFLGFSIPAERLEVTKRRQGGRLMQGVIWGKDPKHLEKSTQLLHSIAQHVRLVSTSASPNALPRHANITWRGHLTPEEWLQLLAQSRFLIGLGNPLLGPSAVDAVSLGCMFINPAYEEPVLEAKYASQHPYIRKALPSHVCEYRQGDVSGALRCVNAALAKDLPAVIPSDFSEERYFDRVGRIFEL